MTLDQAIAQLRKYDTAYAANKPVVSDDVYDALRERVQRAFPQHPYFAEVRDVEPSQRSRKEPLPFVVGSLDKLRPAEVAPWMQRMHAIRKQQGYLVLPKFDGQSVPILYRNGVMQRAWSRGKVEDGVSRGVPVTQNVKHVQGALSTPKPIDTLDVTRETIVVRGEVIMHDNIWRSVYEGASREPNATGQMARDYKNARNMVGGLLNRTTPLVEDLRRCTFIALQLFVQRKGVWLRPYNAHAEWVMLLLMGFTTALNPTRYTVGHRNLVQLVRAGHTCLKSVLPVHDPHAGIGSLAYWEHPPTADEVTQRLQAMRAAVDIKLDGLVVQPLEIGHWIQSGDHLTKRPSFMQSIKLDVYDQDYIDGHVGSIEWRISKQGAFPPRVILKSPLEFDGVEVTYATCNNARHVINWGLRTGRPIRMIRSGDVIPRIVGVYDGGKWIRVAKPDGEATGAKVNDPKIAGTLPRTCPHCGNSLKWNNDRKVQLFCDNAKCVGRHAKRLVTFFETLKVSDVAQGVVQHLAANGMDTVPKILAGATPQRLLQLEGYQASKAQNVSRSIAGALNVPLYKIMHATGYFGDETSALGSTKLADILERVGEGVIERGSEVDVRNALRDLHNFGPTGMRLLLRGLPQWRAFWRSVKHHRKVSVGPATLQGVVCAFTNFRNDEMEAYITQHGGRVSGLSKKTTVLFNGGGTSGKTKKADAYRITVVSESDAWAWLRKRGGT